MQCQRYIREARSSRCVNRLVMLALLSLFLFPAVVFADVKATVGIVGFIPKAEMERMSFQDRMNWTQDRIMEMLHDPIYQPDIIFEPEYMLTHRFEYYEFPPGRENIPVENGASYSIQISELDGHYELQSLGDPDGVALINHINWLKATAQEYQVSFFTDVHEQIDLAPYGKIGAAWDTTGILINKDGQINIVRKMIDFGATWEGCTPEECGVVCGPEEECGLENLSRPFHFWKDRLVGPTIKSFQLTNKENKGYVVLPILCGDIWRSSIPFETGGYELFWTDYHIQKLKENHAPKADIVIHPVQQADPTPWLHNIFEAIENQSFDPQNFLEWDMVYEKFMQKYINENALVREDHSYYFGANGPPQNFAGFELKPFLSGGPQPLGEGRSVVSDHYMILNVDLKEIEHKIDPDRVTANSGAIAKMTFGVPSDAVSSKLYLYCPAGLSIGLGTNNNICNSWQTLSLTANSETQMEFRVTNTTQSVLKAVPNFYIYKASNPNYGYGVSGEITVNPDIVPPVVSSDNEVGVLAYGTTQTTLTVNTNENAICKYDFSPHKTYSTMPYTYATTGGTTHTQLLTGLMNGGLRTTYTLCQDTQQNAMSTDYLKLYMVRLSTADVTAPDPVPSNLTAQAMSSTQARLQWNGSTDVSGAVFYRIYRRLDAPNSSFIYVGMATAATYTDSYYLVKGKKYRYQVLAYDIVRNLSAFSNEISVIMP